MAMASTLLISLALVSAASASQAQLDPKLVRVFVTTDASGDTADLRARRESVKHLSDALAKQKKLLAVVDREELGDLSVEVLERRLNVPRVVVGIGARPGQPPGTPARSVQLVVLIDWRDDDLKVTNKNEPLDAPGAWSSAAGDVARQIQQYITEHRERILAAR
jgi:hypothetical protein